MIRSDSTFERGGSFTNQPLESTLNIRALDKQSPLERKALFLGQSRGREVGESVRLVTEMSPPPVRDGGRLRA